LAIAPALGLNDAWQHAADVPTRKQRVQHVVRVLPGMSLQDGERKFKAERLQRFLPATQRRRRAIDQRPFHVEDRKRMSCHGRRAPASMKLRSLILQGFSGWSF